MSVEAMIGYETGTVQRVTNEKDAAGGAVPTWNTVYSDVPMRDEVTGSRIEERFEQRVMVTSHRIYTMQGGITIGMRIVFDSKTMLVVGTSDRRQRSPAIPTWYEYDCEHETGMVPL